MVTVASPPSTDISLYAFETKFVSNASIVPFSKKTKYSTWLGNYTRYHCLNLLNARKNQNFISIEEPSVKEIMETEASEEKGTKTKNTKI